jgi:hypothetical protein
VTNGDLGDVIEDWLSLGAARGFSHERQEWRVFVVIDLPDGRRSVSMSLDEAALLIQELSSELTAASN